MDPKNGTTDYWPFEGADNLVESTATQPIIGPGNSHGHTASGVGGLTQTRPAGSLGQFKICLVKPLARFLTLPYLRAQRILHLARTVDVFHMQSIFIARQALHLVILLNDLVDENQGPDDEQHEERIALEDELIELLGAMKEWGVDHVDAVYEQHCQTIRRHYATIFKERFYFHESRDPASDPIYQRLSAYDEKTIRFRNWRLRHVESSTEVDRSDSLTQHKEVGRVRQPENFVVDDVDDLEHSLSEVSVDPPVSFNNPRQHLSITPVSSSLEFPSSIYHPSELELQPTMRNNAPVHPLPRLRQRLPAETRPLGTSQQPPSDVEVANSHLRLERARREGEGRRKRDTAPYQPLDPYAYPAGQKKSPIRPLMGAMWWAVDWGKAKIGLGKEEIQGEDVERIDDRFVDVEKKVKLTLGQWIKFALIQVYCHLLLRVPSIYFGRVARILREADLGKEEIKGLISRGEKS